jgi:hypothetical protein
MNDSTSRTKPTTRTTTRTPSKEVDRAPQPGNTPAPDETPRKPGAITAPDEDANS